MLALEGVKVIDLTGWVAASHCTQWLADLGAQVIKIEDPVSGGDPARNVQERQRHWKDPVEPGMSGLFQHMDRNKKSCAIDLKRPEGKQLLYALVEKADVFATNMRPKAQATLGVEYDTLREHNPRLIYLHLSGYGGEGPCAERAAFGPQVLARSGLLACLGEPEAPPVFPPPGLADHAAGVIAALGVTTALFVRERTGIGQRIDTSLLAASTDMSCSDITSALLYGQSRPRRSRKTPTNPLYNCYLTKDRVWIVLNSFQSDRYWPSLCKVLASPELQSNPNFLTHEKRCSNAIECSAALDEAFAGITFDEWSRGISGEDMAWEAVKSFTDVGSDPQYLANGYVVDFDHPRLGPTKMLGTPLHFSETPAGLRTVAPELGQHTEEVLFDLLGLDWDDIAKLRDASVIL